MYILTIQIELVMRRHLILLLILSFGTCISSAGAQLFDAPEDIPDRFESSEPDGCVAARLQFRLQLTADTDEGNIHIQVYNNKNSFLRRKDPVREIIVPAKADTKRVCISLPKSGPYALAGFHDVDGNGKLNKLLWMFPREPVFYSNTAKAGLIGGVPYDEAVMNISDKGVDLAFDLSPK